MTEGNKKARRDLTYGVLNSITQWIEAHGGEVAVIHKPVIEEIGTEEKSSRYRISISCVGKMPQGQKAA